MIKKKAGGNICFRRPFSPSRGLAGTGFIRLSGCAVKILAAEPTGMRKIGPEGIAASLREKSAAAVLVAAQAQRTVGTAAAAILIDWIPFTVEPFAFVRASAHGGDFAVHTGPFAAVTVAITIANAVASALTPVVTTTSHKIITPFVQN